MSMEGIVAAMLEAAPSHTLAGASDAAELDELERRLGHPLPAAYREFLARVGGGIFYQRHEIFGPRRVMLHDIEFVPDLMSLRRMLAAEGRQLREGTIPVHRAGAMVHLLDLDPGAGHGRVVAEGQAESYQDFARFLEAVVLPAPTAS